jgi:hypothetical protein
LRDAEQYLAVLSGFPQKFPPGERFSCHNNGFAVLALIAEQISGVPAGLTGAPDGLCRSQLTPEVGLGQHQHW